MIQHFNNLLALAFIRRTASLENGLLSLLPAPIQAMALRRKAIHSTLLDSNLHKTQYVSYVIDINFDGSNLTI